jgi:hypothetical protein
MTTLMLKDLSRTEELNRKAMGAMHGGRINDPPVAGPRPPLDPNDTSGANMTDAWWINSDGGKGGGAGGMYNWSSGEF